MADEFFTANLLALITSYSSLALSPAYCLHASSALKGLNLLTCCLANFDDDASSADEDTHHYVNKEVEDSEKEGDKYPMGRPNSFLNRMISHGNQKTEKEVAEQQAAYEARQRAGQGTMGGGQYSSGQESGLRQEYGTGQVGGGQAPRAGGNQNITHDVVTK